MTENDDLSDHEALARMCGQYYYRIYTKEKLLKREAEERLKLAMKALRVIEGLALASKTSPTPLYKFAHIAICSCKNKHEDWHKELDEMEEALIEAGVISKEVPGE